MSVLCEVRMEPRIVGGEIVNPGETAMIPNSLALQLVKKGLVVWASPEAHIQRADEKRARQELAELAKMEADDEKAGKKGKR